MTAQELIRLLERFDPQAEVRLCASMPGQAIETYQQIWVGDYGGGPQIHTARDFRQFYIYVGCGLEQFVTDVPTPNIDLGVYNDPQAAAMVHDFYVVHRRLHEPLAYPPIRLRELDSAADRFGRIQPDRRGNPSDQAASRLIANGKSREPKTAAFPRRTTDQLGLVGLF